MACGAPEGTASALLAQNNTISNALLEKPIITDDLFYGVARRRHCAGGKKCPASKNSKNHDREKIDSRIHGFTLMAVSAMAVLHMAEEHSILPVNRNVLDLKRPVALVGLMGAGKSTIGRRLARDIGLEFIDSDTEISLAAGCSISDIFEIYGEAIFRDLEKRVLLRLLSGEPAVIATGGGAFINPEIREAVGKNAVSVWLKADINTLVERVSRRDTRPLLKTGDKRATLTRLIDERHPVYAEADIVIDSDDGAHEKVVKKIIKCLSEFTGKIT